MESSVARDLCHRVLVIYPGGYNANEKVFLVQPQGLNRRLVDRSSGD
jgi:hypothetical protein